VSRARALGEGAAFDAMAQRLLGHCASAARFSPLQRNWRAKLGFAEGAAL